MLWQNISSKPSAQSLLPSQMKSFLMNLLSSHLKNAVKLFHSGNTMGIDWYKFLACEKQTRIETRIRKIFFVVLQIHLNCLQALMLFDPSDSENLISLKQISIMQLDFNMSIQKKH
ncbi:CLUMA_CG010209, isoform A [Clunio marinus]|uniref:CLUMA_CG010209, isoform A n=1 Tax=Clunio marinus TaxID=568069 RepID=A0A1J1I8M2_9DIPT|nr:CLUMA_CG010209, isoform A [Clunio marinus]